VVIIDVLLTLAFIALLTEVGKFLRG
jgi:hypothetical protein